MELGNPSGDIPTLVVTGRKGACFWHVSFGFLYFFDEG